MTNGISEKAPRRSSAAAAARASARLAWPQGVQNYLDELITSSRIEGTLEKSVVPMGVVPSKVNRRIAQMDLGHLPRCELTIGGQKYYAVPAYLNGHEGEMDVFTEKNGELHLRWADDTVKENTYFPPPAAPQTAPLPVAAAAAAMPAMALDMPILPEVPVTPIVPSIASAELDSFEA
jgi:hypothetical protein